MFSLKIWQKLLISVSVVILIVAVVSYSTHKENACCLCNSARYHAPCLIDLETGEMTELDLYFPHPALVAELAEDQPEMGTFSFIGLGNVTGIKLTNSKTIELNVPLEKTTKPVLCKTCRKQLSTASAYRYILADLYAVDNKILIPIREDLSTTLRCYKITAQKTSNILKIKILGIL